MSTVLVINSGSSSLKYALVDPGLDDALASGLVERIGESGSRIVHKGVPGDPGAKTTDEMPIPDHTEALRAVLQALESSGILADHSVDAVGHRVVHGGASFSEPVLVTDEVIEAIEEVVPLAPLHNPANLLGIRGALTAYPDVPQVVVFDTAFHATLPPAAYTYAIDRAVAEEHSLRRYGFHGTSHKYVTSRAAEYLGVPLDEVNLVSLHLGNGASACAVKGGKSVETSMGVGPLEGLVMGTRSGDVDPTVLFQLGKAGKSIEELDALLNKQSGMKGLCGDNDLREVQRRADGGDEVAETARQVYAHRLRKYVGAYLAVLGGANAIVFTAGVGENDSWVRENACSGLEIFGISIDRKKNAELSRPDDVVEISSPGSPVKVLVIPTDEEREIATQTLAVIGA